MLLTSLLSTVSAVSDESLKLHYTFRTTTNIVPDITGNGFEGTLVNGATVTQIDSAGVLLLGSGNGYLDMGAATGNLIASLNDFTISTFLYLDSATSISGNGNFLWVFSTNNACSSTNGKYIAYRVNRQRYAQSTGGYNNEKVAIESGTEAAKGAWMHISYTQSGTTGTLYLNGSVLATGTALYKPSDIGTATMYNWIGRPHFSGDSYLYNAKLSDFRIYNRALSVTEIGQLVSQPGSVAAGYAKNMLLKASTSLELGFDTINSDIRLPRITNEGNLPISWSSSKPEYLTPDGFVTRPAAGTDPVRVELAATMVCFNDSIQKSFVVTVMPELNDGESVLKDLEDITLKANLTNLRQNLSLPASGTEGSVITWTSDKTEILGNNGDLLKFPAKGSGSLTVHLTATATKGNATANRTIEVVIPEDEGYTSYLFVYFTGNSGSQEAIRFGVSPDGLNYKALNSNLPVIASDTIARMFAVRDPHILRTEDGAFYMVVTDMRSANGWDSNHGMVLLKSTDLINWKHSAIDIAATFPKFSTVTRVWAPQTIYDAKAGKYMIYWSMRSGNDPDVIHYSYVNDDFTSLISEPKVLYNNPLGTACIDGDIIYENGVYNLFFKTEGSGNGIKKAESVNLTGPYVIKNDKYLQQTTSAVEGACVFRLINSDKYMLIYDVYTNGRYEFTESTDLVNFKLVSDVSLDFAPRHGTIIPITTEEAEALAKKWGKSDGLSVITAEAPEVKRINIVTDNTAKTVYLPVKSGTDLTAFDPQLATLPGASVLPAGLQDFTKGAVNYTLSLNGASVNYSVSAQINKNPVLDGYYADPEILYSEKTGLFYLYPTSDGFPGWSGTYFKVFSSPDMVSWKDEGVIIDLPSDVSWAKTNAWAPCIVEKKINGKYKYFYYFTAAQKIGVAVSSNPTGPFIDSGKALISSKPAGVSGGQEIDPDVFTDPATGKSYLYWGNGYMAGVELNNDMISIKSETMKVMTPNSTFREGTYVIYRNGKYYFMWSQDDTGSPNYCVRYATSNSPLGNFTIPANNLVISRDNAKAIYGTGHNSVVQIPGKDEWYIVYHRFTRPKGITLSSPGYYREVCIDKMEFNLDGSIKQVQPTLEGIAPVSVSTDLIKVKSQKKNDRIAVWPNPVNDFLNFSIPESIKGDLLLEVLNLSGVSVMKTKINSSVTSLNCSRLSSGFYYLRAKKGESNYFGKFVKS